MTLEYHLSSLLSYVFYGIWPVILLWEILVPARKTELSLPSRWSGNFGLYIINFFISKWMAVLLGAGAVAFASAHGFGLMSHATLPLGLQIVAGVLMIDLSIYGFHILTHKVHWLWRLHRGHHTDPEMDFSTYFRHHPLESLAGTGYSFLVTLIAGFPPETLLVQQVLSQLIEPLSHGNVGLPKWFEDIMRLVFVTPAMHLVHHSADKRETDSNYGGIFSFWDRLFGTYVAAPALGPQDLTMGLESFRDLKYARLPGALAIPFLNEENAVSLPAPVADRF